MIQDFKRFDVVLVDFGKDVIGSEQAGIRPAIIIQNDKGNKFSANTIVMPLTSEHKKLNQPTHTLLKHDEYNGLSEDSVVLGECLRHVSEKRIIKYMGYLNSDNDRREIKRVYFANFGE